MATKHETTAQVYTCPRCAGELIAANHSTECADCGHVPGHGAD